MASLISRRQQYVAFEESRNAPSTPHAADLDVTGIAAAAKDESKSHASSMLFPVHSTAVAPPPGLSRSRSSLSSSSLGHRLQGHLEQAAALQMLPHQRASDSLPTTPQLFSHSPREAASHFVGAVAPARPFEFLGVVESAKVARNFANIKAEHGLFLQGDGGGVGGRGAGASAGGGSAAAAAMRKSEAAMLEERLQQLLARDAQREVLRRQREQEQLSRDAKEIAEWMAYHKQQDALELAAAMGEFHAFATDSGATDHDSSGLLGNNNNSNNNNDNFLDADPNCFGGLMRRHHNGNMHSSQAIAALANLNVTISALRENPQQITQALVVGGAARALSHLRNLSPSRSRKRKLEADFARIETNVRAKRIAEQKRVAGETKKSEEDASMSAAAAAADMNRAAETSRPADDCCDGNRRRSPEPRGISSMNSSAAISSRQSPCAADDSGVVSQRSGGVGAINNDADVYLSLRQWRWVEHQQQQSPKKDGGAHLRDGSRSDSSNESSSDSDSGRSKNDSDCGSSISSLQINNSNIKLNTNYFLRREEVETRQRNQERDYMEVQWRLALRVICTNILLCEHDEAKARAALREQEEEQWHALYRFFARGVEQAALRAASKSLIRQMLAEREEWVGDLNQQLEWIREAFLEQKQGIRTANLYSLFMSCDGNTQQMLLEKTEEQREHFLDMLQEEKFLKQKVSSLKKRAKAAV